MSNKNQLIGKWLEIAQNNIWIKQRGSHDPNDDCAFEDPLTIKDFFECKSIKELHSQLIKGNWLLGQPFYFKNLCFINQINAGDEFLVIRDDIEFESITSECFSEQKFEDWVNCVLNASEEQLRRLEYTTEEYEKNWRINKRVLRAATSEKIYKILNN
ncbi:hypothetical protein LCGC14_0656530 [marine sediment metagenome]|uniref:Uncharacterized protein n=1 Tax=marine sediment metagenome TaxID=412755 RepID=A0A0F9U360_9ZZZZ